MLLLGPRCWFSLVVLAAAEAAAAVSSERVEALFRPFLADQVTLSPDGKYVAYTEHVKDELHIVIMNLDGGGAKTTVIAGEDRVVLHSKEKERARLRFLRWATATRLVFAPTPEIIRPAVRPPPPAPPLEPQIIAPIMAVDADGKNPRRLLDSSDFEISLEGTEDAVRSRPRMTTILGFVPEDRNHLLVHVDGIRGSSFTPSEVVRVDVNTGKFSTIGSAEPGGRMVYDWQGRPRLRQEVGMRETERTFEFTSTEKNGKWRLLHEAAQGAVGARFTVSPENYFAARAMPLGFDFDPNVLIYAANAGRNTFGIYGLNLATMQRTDLAVEHPGRDMAPLDSFYPARNLVFDEWRKKLVGVRTSDGPPLTVWLDQELGELQRRVDAQFPRRYVEILEWDMARTRFLIRVTGGADPGRYYVLRQPEKLFTEIFRRAPWLPNAELHDTRFVEFDGPEGSRLSGYLTLPRKPRLNPPPLVIRFASTFPARAAAVFDRDAQLLADLGLAVLRLNHRGVAGFGAKHRDAVQGAIDRAPVADARAAIEWLVRHHPIDRKRVVAMGEGFGGYLAVRATQLEPEVFRCAIAIEPPLNLKAWLEPPVNFDAPGLPTFSQQINRAYLERAGTKLLDVSVTAHPDALRTAVFVVYRSHVSNAVSHAIANFRSQLKRRDVPHAFVDVGDDFFAGLPGARARMYRELEPFLNLNLYDFKVRIGPTREVK